MNSQLEVRLSREMRLLDITLIGVGAMIGAGIFVLTGIAAGVAGPGLLLVFLLNGVVTLFAAMAYAELGSAFHDAGGGYLWVKTGLKDPQGFLSGWMSWFAHAVACALYALGFGAYFRLVLPALGIHRLSVPFLTLDKWLAVGVIGIFAYINYRGASETGKAGSFVTIAKIIILAVFIGFGVWITLSRPNWQVRFENFLPHGVGGVITGMGLTFIAFEGYEIIAQSSEETRDPRRNVPRAIFLSLLIAVPIYLFVAFSAIGAVQVHGMTSWQYLGLKKETALVDAASNFFRGGGTMILVAGLLSTASALNATIYSSSRVSFAMGRDRNLPTWFGRIHSKRKTPYWAILFSAMLIATMAVALPVEAVASAADIMFLLLFVQVLVVVMSLRKKRPDLKRGFRVPWLPVVPIIGIVLQVFLAAYLFFYSPMAWLSAGAWIALGLFVFYGYSRKRDRAYSQVVASREAAERREYRILACLAHPARARGILEIAQAVARRYKGEVLALAVVEVPEGEVLAKGLDEVEGVRKLLEGALVDFRREGTPARALVNVSHRVSSGIIETALEEGCNLIIMGRARRESLLERLGATIVDRVVRSAPAQIVVVSAEQWPDEVKRILLPYVESSHTELATDLVSAFATSYHARVRAVSVVPFSASASDQEKAREALESYLGQRYPEAELRVIQTADITAGLLRQSTDADLIVMGGSEAGVLEQLLSYSVPLELADRTRKPVIVVYEMAAEPKHWIV